VRTDRTHVLGVGLPEATMGPAELGIRCRDVHLALTALDAGGAGVLGFRATRLVGMAAGLANGIRGQRTVLDARSLRDAARAELAVNPARFDEVVRLLHEAGFVHQVESQGSATVTFHEDVPDHEVLWSTLGQLWLDARPSLAERLLIEMTHLLASGPVRADSLAAELGVTPGDLADVLELGRACALVRSVRTHDGVTLYSPLMAFEHPAVVATALAAHGPAAFAGEIPFVRQHQGVDVAHSAELADAVVRGLVLAVSVVGSSGQTHQVAFVPDPADPTVVDRRKDVLDKALALAATLRLAQWAGLSARGAGQVLDHLRDHRNHAASMSTSHRHSQPALQRLQLVDFVPGRSGRGLDVRLVATEDNLSALALADDLLRDWPSHASWESGAIDVAAVLAGLESYAGPVPALQQCPLTCRVEDRAFSDAVAVLTGRSRLAKALECMVTPGGPADWIIPAAGRA
jgi:hypothetical protein